MKKKLLVVALSTIAFGSMIVSCNNTNSVTKDETSSTASIINKFNFEASASLNLLSKVSLTPASKINSLRSGYDMNDYNDTLDANTLEYLKTTILKEANSIINSNETITSSIFTFATGEEIVYENNTFSKAIKVNFKDQENNLVYYTFLYSETTETVNKNSINNLDSDDVTTGGTKVDEGDKDDDNDTDDTDTDDDNDTDDDKDDTDDNTDDKDDDDTTTGGTDTDDDNDDTDNDQDEDDDGVNDVDDEDDDNDGTDDKDETDDDHDDIDDNDEISNETSTTGYAYIGNLDLSVKSIPTTTELYKFTSTIEDGTTESNREFTLTINEKSYIKVSQESETNENEFSYLVVNNGVKTIDYSVSLENIENVNKVEIKENGVEYKVVKHTFETSILYMVEIEKDNTTLKQIFKKDADGNFSIMRE